MTDSDRMVAWLRETLDAAQRDAEAADGAEWSVEDLRLIDQRDGKLVETGRAPGTLLIGNGLRIASGVPAALAHVARQSPAAVLRRIAADRKQLAEHEPVPDHGRFSHSYGTTCPDWCEDACRDKPQVCLTCRDSSGDPVEASCRSLEFLAEGYGWTEETT